MRGQVTLATAFALPGDFPQRDLIVVSAFAVVLATLVVQGLTLTPQIRLLGLADGDDRREKIVAKRALADAALSAIGDAPGQVAEDMRRHFEIDRAALDGGEACEDFNARQQLKLKAIAAQRDRLDALRDQDAIGQEEYERLQEGLDWHELAIGPADQRTIEEG